MTVPRRVAGQGPAGALKIAKDLHAKDLLEPLWDGGGDPDLLQLGERSHRPKDAFRILELCAREAARMPSCVRRDRTRLSPVRGAERAAQPGSNCADDCRLRMCPCPAKVESLRVEFSEVFRLHQRDMLKKWQPWAWASLRLRREAPWQRGVPVAGMRRFWDQMSDRARDIDPGTDPVSPDGRHFARVSRSR